MFKSLYFKIVLILVIFIITVMCVVGTVMIFSVFDFYNDEFQNQMDSSLAEDSTLFLELKMALSTDDFPTEQKKILDSYSGMLGIDQYRNFYILDMNGEMLAGSDTELGKNLIATPNMIAAMNQKRGTVQVIGAEFSDYAVYISNEGSGSECLIYIKDTLEEVHQLSQMLFTIILQSLFMGLLIAIILSFFLAKAITFPIQNLTYGAQLVASGKFNYEIDAHSKDEIGTLTDTFNHMKDVLKSTLDQVDGERQKLETVFSYLRDAVIAFTDDGFVLHNNISAVELFGERWGESFKLDKMLDYFDISFDGKNLTAGGGESNTEHTHDGGFVFHDVVFDDKVFDVSFGAIKYTANNNTHIGLITIIHDVTNRYELDKSRREFVANVSHELRTPLTSVKGACETIIEDPDMPVEIRQHFLDMAITESDRMTRIVADLLVLSRLDNNRTRWKIEKFDIRDSIRHLCEAMKVTLESHKHTLSTKFSKDLSEITGDRDRIEQVLINIISNAIKYTPDGGKIEIFAKNANNGIYIVIRDNGIGIPKEDLNHIFERFYRVEKSRTSETGGTGLGLAIAREIIIAHGGDIKILSKIDEGTAVVIFLPFETNLKTTE